MEFTVEVGDQKELLVDYSRNWFTGAMQIRVNGELIAEASALNPSTHFTVRLTEAIEFQVGEHQVLIERRRPLLFAGFRPHRYRVFVDDRLVFEQAGY